MKRQLALLVAATTSLVLIAFLVPLGYLVHQVAADRAVNAATHEAESLAPIVATVDTDTLAVTVEQVSAQSAFPLTIFLPDGSSIGARVARSNAVVLAGKGKSLITDTGSGREVLVAVQGVDNGTAVIRSFVPTSAMWSGVVRAWVILGLLGLALLGLSLLVANRMARSLLWPMHELAKVSHLLGAGQLDAKVKPAGPPELRDVGRAMNQLAERIGELIAAEREAAADHSHRLRTPLTVLRLDAEALQDPAEAERIGADVDAVERSVDDMIHEARRPVREGLLVRADAGSVVAARVEFFSALAEEEDRRVHTQLDPGPLPVRVSSEDLAAAVDALLGNIYAHTPPGTGYTVMLRAGREDNDGGATLTIADDGPGFVSDNPACRGNTTAGSTGLGLDIVRRTAEASGGQLIAGSAPEGAISRGAQLTVELGPARTG